MALYSAAPTRRALQLLADVSVLAWMLLWVLLGRLVHDRTLEGFAPAGRIVGTGERINQGISDADERLGDMPIIGDELSGVLDDLVGVGDPVAQTGRDMLATGESLADDLWFLVAAGPVLTALAVWLPVRLAFVLRSARTARAVRSLEHPAPLLALRALGSQPVDALVRIHPDPVAAWRAGDPEVVDALARAEARSLGLRWPARRAG